MRSTGPKIPPIPADLDAGAHLAAINDRLRRIEQLTLAGGAPGVPGKNGGVGSQGATGPAGTGGSGATYQAHMTLATNTTINSPAVPTDGQIWVVRVDQNATGGAEVTWGTDVLLGPQIDSTINSDPLTMCIVTFAGFGGKWYMCSVPVLGVPI